MERDLIKRLGKRDENAYIEAIDLYGDRLLKTCYLILKNEGEAEDVVQESLLKLFNHISTFKGQSSLYTWIYRIALNLCRDKLRKREDFTLLEDLVESKTNIEEIVIDRFTREELKKELFNLNSIYKEVLILFYFEELSIREISEILGEKEGTIKSRLSRGRILLKDAMERGGGIDEKG